MRESFYERIAWLRSIVKALCKFRWTKKVYFYHDEIDKCKIDIQIEAAATVDGIYVLQRDWRDGNFQNEGEQQSLSYFILDG